MFKVSIMKSSSQILQFDVEHNFWSASHSDIWNRLWVKVLRISCVDFVNVWSQIFVFARISFTFLSGAEQISWCRALGKLCQRRDSVPLANSSSQSLQIWHTFNNTQWYLHSHTVKTFHSRPVVCEMLCHVLHLLLAVLSFCVTTAVVLLCLPTTPVFEMWFWVLLNCTGHLWHLPRAVLAPTPALNSVWCFGSKGLCSLTDLDLHVGNSAEGKQPPRGGWCLVWTQDRWCGHSGTGSVHDGVLIALLAISSVVEWAQVGSGCCCGDKGLWAGGFVRLTRKSPQTKDICWHFFRKQRWA